MTEHNLTPVFIECPSRVKKRVAQSYSRLAAARVTKDHLSHVVRVKRHFTRWEKTAGLRGRRGRGRVARLGNQ